MSDMAQNFIGGQGLLRADVFVNLAWMTAALIKIFFLTWAAAECIHCVFFRERSVRNRLICSAAAAAAVIALYLAVKDMTFFAWLYAVPVKLAALPVAAIVLILSIVFAVLDNKSNRRKSNESRKNY
jgi:hypothetical protein